MVPSTIFPALSVAVYVNSGIRFQSLMVEFWKHLRWKLKNRLEIDFRPPEEQDPAQQDRAGEGKPLHPEPGLAERSVHVGLVIIGHPVQHIHHLTAHHSRRQKLLRFVGK